MSGQPRYTLQALWGARAVSVDDVAVRLRSSLAVLNESGGSLAGPWKRDYTRNVDPSDRDALLALVATSPIKDDDGAPEPQSGYVPRLTLGDWEVPQGAETETGRLYVSALVNSPFSSAVLVVEGQRLAEQVREHSATLVSAFAKAWQPDVVALTDPALMTLHEEALSQVFPRRRHVPWGYVAWVSDAYSRDLNGTSGAFTSRLGAGTLIQTPQWTALEAGEMWTALLHARKLRALGDVQAALPQFEESP